jgi:hypothetical protein
MEWNGYTFVPQDGGQQFPVQQSLNGNGEQGVANDAGNQNAGQGVTANGSGGPTEGENGAEGDGAEGQSDGQTARSQESDSSESDDDPGRGLGPYIAEFQWYW